MSALGAPAPMPAREAVAIRQEEIAVECESARSTVWQRMSEVAGVVAFALFVVALVVAS